MLYVCSVVPGATETVTGALALPPASAVRSPEDGVMVSPAGAVAVQCTLLPCPERSCTPTLAVAVPPAGATTREGSTKVLWLTAPSVNDGGASACAAPQAVLGVDDSEKSSVPPVLTNDSGSHGLVQAWPLSLSELMYGVE